MTLSASLFSWLTGDAALAAVVSDRVYPQVLPEDNVVPTVVYSFVGAPKSHTQDGPSYKNPRIRFECWGKTNDDAEALAIVLGNALDCRNVPGVGKCVVDDDGMDDYEPSTGLHRKFVDVLVWT